MSKCGDYIVTRLLTEQDQETETVEEESMRKARFDRIMKEAH